MNEAGENCESYRLPSNVWVFTPHIAFEDWLETAAMAENGGSYSKRSRIQFCAIFRVFCRYILERKISIFDITVDEIEKFLESRGLVHQVGKNTASHDSLDSIPITRTFRQSHYRYIFLLAKVMDHLVQAGYRHTNPFDNEQLRSCVTSSASKSYQCLSPRQDAALQKYLLHQICTSTWHDRRNRAMMLFMLGTGVTDFEARNARIEQFYFDEMVSIFRPDTSTDAGTTIIPLADFCVEAVRQWLKECARRESVKLKSLAFPSPNGRQLSSVLLFMTVTKALRCIGFEGSHTCTGVLRNTWCQRQLLAGVDGQVIQRRMGLRTQKTVAQIGHQAVVAEKTVKIQ